jgi:hypothetical protein
MMWIEGRHLSTARSFAKGKRETRRSPMLPAEAGDVSSVKNLSYSVCSSQYAPAYDC